MTVLLVCHANTCRSVMAHVLLERMLRAHGVDGRVAVRSAGVGNHARDGMIASLDTRLVLREVGITLGEYEFTSTSLRDHPDLLAGADLVVTMTEAQREAVAAMPEAAGRPVLTLRGLAGVPGDIDDPMGQGEDVYSACRDAITAHLDRALPRILALAGGAISPR